MKTYKIWILAAIITVAAAVFQRITGPTYPLKGTKEIAGQKIKYKLTRSAEVAKNINITAPAINDYQAFLVFKKYKTNDSLTYQPMTFDNQQWLGQLPPLPAAGKYIYNIYYQHLQNTNQWLALSDKNVVIRFKGEVPTWILILHILFIFSAMLFSNFTGILTVSKNIRSDYWAKITLVFLIIGGFIFGPIVQKYAFGAFWTGFPFGYDLTDNKVLISVLAWVFALMIYKRSRNPRWFLIASIVTFAIYLIPHSLFGSELDFTSGVIKQG